MEAYIWLALAAVFIFVEAITPAFVSLWFAGGALIAMVLAFFDVKFWIQIVVFVAASGILMVATRPLYNKYIKRKIVHTNLDRLVGQIAVITQPVDDIEYKGEAKVNGQLWNARIEDGSSAAVGERRRILEISGTKLILSKEIENKEN